MTPVVETLSPGWVQELLINLAKAQIRRECRRLEFDWSAFVVSKTEQRIGKAVQRRAVQQGLKRGLDGWSGDIPMMTAVGAVRDVITKWDNEPDLRPAASGFREEQARRGEKGREKQQKLAARREEQVLALVAEGVSNNAEIGRRLRLGRSSVSRIRLKADNDVWSEPEVPASSQAEQYMFHTDDIPPEERWPVVQFTNQTGVALDADEAQWLADMGRCYVAEGREADLMDAIKASARARLDPWAYLQRCVSNRGDTWTVQAQLLADALVWAGETKLTYALGAIGAGSVMRPLPYLHRVLAQAANRGKRADSSHQAPVAAAVGMAQRLAGNLIVLDADTAMAAEAEKDQSRRSDLLQSFQRRWGRLPWEDEATPEDNRDTYDSEAQNCPIGLNGLRFDEINYQDPNAGKPDSSPGTVKANGTLPDRKQTAAAVVNPTMCRHPVERLITAARLITAGIVLDNMVPVECSVGCGHWLYSDRGPLVCPCHWSSARVSMFTRSLEKVQARSAVINAPDPPQQKWSRVDQLTQIHKTEHGQHPPQQQPRPIDPTRHKPDPHIGKEIDETGTPPIND